MKRFEVIQGQGPERTIVCTWCAAKFLTRENLDAHRATDPRCKANANSNNPTQSKYGMASGIENIPGEAMLTKIRQPGCKHPGELREDIFPDLSGQGAATGYRCGFCYTEIYFSE